jgi:hypothetical protein
MGVVKQVFQVCECRAYQHPEQACGGAAAMSFLLRNPSCRYVPSTRPSRWTTSMFVWMPTANRVPVTRL